jgi:hypothetical protein
MGIKLKNLKSKKKKKKKKEKTKFGKWRVGTQDKD